MKLSSKILSIAFLALAIGSCKEDKTCKANIICQDQNGAPVKGADVMLYATIRPNLCGDVKAQGVTDQNGKVSFVFELPAIFDVKAEVNTKSTIGKIKLEEGKTTDATLTIK